MPLVFWNEIPQEIASLEDLKGRVISVEASSFQEGVLKKISGVKLKQIEKIADGIMEIRYGKSEAVMVDPSILPGLKAKYPQIKILEIPLPPGDCSQGNGVCINQNNPALAKEIRQAVDALYKEGKIQELEKKWRLQ